MLASPKVGFRMEKQFTYGLHGHQMNQIMSVESVVNTHQNKATMRTTGICIALQRNLSHVAAKLGGFLVAHFLLRGWARGQDTNLKKRLR